MTRLLILPIFTLLLFATLNTSMADVILEDITENSIFPLNSNTASIETGAGSAGDYVLLLCANNIGAGNPFNLPSPLQWEELNTEPCGGPACTMGIWGGFADDPGSIPVNCSWLQTADVFIATGLRYSGVDTTNPIIDLQCNSGSGTIITSPSVFAENNSYWVLVFQVGLSEIDNNMNAMDFTQVTNGQVSVTEIFVTGGAVPDGPVITMEGFTENITVGGQLPSFEVESNIPTDWKACALTIRMATEPRNVPTMSEWGLITFAALTGITGFWFIRRRSATA